MTGSINQFSNSRATFGPFARVRVFMCASASLLPNAVASTYTYTARVCVYRCVLEPVCDYMCRYAALSCTCAERNTEPRLFIYTFPTRFPTWLASDSQGECVRHDNHAETMMHVCVSVCLSRILTQWGPTSAHMVTHACEHANTPM